MRRVDLRVEPERLRPYKMSIRRRDLCIPFRPQSFRIDRQGHCALRERNAGRPSRARDILKPARNVKTQIFGRHGAQHRAADFKLQLALPPKGCRIKPVLRREIERRLTDERQEVRDAAQPRAAKASQRAFRVQPRDVHIDPRRLQLTDGAARAFEAERIAPQHRFPRQPQQRRHRAHIAHIRIGELEAERQVLVRNRLCGQRLSREIEVQRRTGHPTVQNAVSHPVPGAERKIDRPVIKHVCLGQLAFNRAAEFDGRQQPRNRLLHRQGARH